MKPDYSFIIGVKNRQELLGRCLESVLWQDYSSYEVIVVDYGSDPRAVVPDDQRIRVVYLDPEDVVFNNCIAFNAGIANARGERLVLMCCDNILAPNLLSSVHTIAKEKALQIYWRRFDLTELGLHWLADLEPLSAEKCFQSMSPESLIELGLGKWHGLTSHGDFLMIEKAPVMALGGYDERMSGWGEWDNDMMRRLRQLGYQKYWGKEFKLVHQFHPSQKTIHESYWRNLRISRREKAAGSVIRNEGAKNFEKYRV